jgi:hypothetical protein
MKQTPEEIKAAYPREWVLIVDCEFDEAGRLVAGTVAAHSPRREEIYREVARHDSGAIEYTGPFPKDYAAIL